MMDEEVETGIDSDVIDLFLLISSTREIQLAMAQIADGQTICIPCF